jgi:hypothetical protein
MAQRVAGRTTKCCVAHTRMARRTEMKMVRIHAASDAQEQVTAVLE